MLELAKLHEEELKKLAGKVLIDDKYKYFNVGYMNLPEPTMDEWNNLCFVSYSDRVIGYFNAAVNRTHGIINSLAIWSTAASLKEYKVFEKDLLEFFIYCLKRYPVIQWSVVTENPVKKKYRRFIQTINGNIVGTYHKCCKVYNEMLDEECYEVISSPEIIQKIEKLKERIK